MAYIITILDVPPRWIAAARGQKAMLALLGRAWNYVKQTGIKTDGQNVAIYSGGMIDAGARVYEKFEGNGEINCVASPSGLAATTIHMGLYELLGDAHKAIREWCAANGHAIEGTNWEVYGHHEDDPAKRRTDVFYLLRS
jgi:effector-binding domain-containing protein